MLTLDEPEQIAAYEAIIRSLRNNFIVSTCNRTQGKDAPDWFWACVILRLSFKTQLLFIVHGKDYADLVG